MKSVLVLVASDPRRGGRAAEGFRVADGLSLAEGLAVAVLVAGPAAREFGDPAGETARWEDGYLLLRHAAALRARGVPLRIAGRAREVLERELELLPVSEEEAKDLRHGVDVAMEF